MHLYLIYGLQLLVCHAQSCANPTANPTTTTTYTLIVSTTENGDNGINACSGSKKVTVTVNNLPDGSITGATGLCNGASTTQICAKEVPAGNISYSWSTGWPQRVVLM